MKKSKFTKEEQAIAAVAEYLRSIGWNLLVGQFTGIEQGNLKYNFRLIFSFTGSKKKKPTQPKEEK